MNVMSSVAFGDRSHWQSYRHAVRSYILL